MKHLLTVIVLVAMCILTPDPGFAATRLTVEVRNQTANGAGVIGDDVVLHLYRGPQHIESHSAKVGEDGKAIFEDLPVGQGTAAVARVKHQNMAFRSEPVPLDSAVAELSTDVQVFDVSTDASKLSVGVHHLMIALRGSSLEFTEFLQLNNASDMAVTASERDSQDRPVVLTIMLPQGFRDLTTSSYLKREALVVTQDGFYDTMAVPPGEHEVTFSYKLDVSSGTTQIVKEISLATSHLMIFWEHGQGALEGLGEPDNRLVNADGIPVEYYRRTDLKAGERLAFRVTGLPEKDSGTSTWILLTVVFAALLIVALLRPGRRAAKRG